MLPAPHRLRGDVLIQHVARKGRPFFSALLTIKLLPNTLSRARCAIVVSTRVSKKAVYRNKLKRRLREILRPLLPRIRSGHDLLLITKKQAAEADFDSLANDVHRLLTKAHLL